MTTVKQLLAALDISPRDMARLLGTTTNRISDFVTGQRSETKQLQAYLKFLEYAGSESIKKYLREIDMNTCECWSFDSEDRWFVDHMTTTTTCRECGHGRTETFDFDEHGHPENAPRQVNEF